MAMALLVNPDSEILVGIVSAVLLVVVSVLIYVGKQKQARKYAGAIPLPPGPRPWPIIGNLGIIGPLAHQDFARLLEKYGPVMQLRMGSVNAVVISSADASRELLTKYDRAVAGRPNTSQFQILANGSQTLVSGSYGPYWRNLRKVFTLQLLTARRLHQFQEFRKDTIFYLLETVLSDCKEKTVLQMRDRFNNATNDVICRMVINSKYFGRNASTSDVKERKFLTDTFGEILTLLAAFVPGDYIPLLKHLDILGYRKRMRAVQAVTSKVFGSIIDEHRQNRDSSSEAQDFVDVLLDPTIMDDKTPLSDTQIRAILQELFVAGTETTSTTAEWAMTELLRNPSALRRAQEELDNVIGRDRLVDESDLSSLPYLHAVVKETFRCHPPVPLLVPHLSTEPCEVEGYRIPNASVIFFNTWAIGRDPKIWDNPSDFSPERFLNSPIDTAGQHFQLLPFGSGRRICPARVLGLTLVQFMLAGLLHTFEWSLPPGCSPGNLNMDEARGATTPRAVLLQAVASPRLSPAILSGLVRT